MPVNSMKPPAADIDELRRSYDEVIRIWEKTVAEHEKLMAAFRELGVDTTKQERQHQLSYVQLAIAVLEELGKPTPIGVLLEHIQERRKDPNITRGSVETSLLRYLNNKGDTATIVKPYPGTYALRQHVGQISA